MRSISFQHQKSPTSMSSEDITGDTREIETVNMIENSGYSMAELVEESGFTERQIRHYISEGLVKGAEGMGRNARYSEETLVRLKLIRKLKEQDVEPLGRPLTLREMKNTLDSLDGSQVEYLLSGAAMFKLIDTEDAAEFSAADASPIDRQLDAEYLKYQTKDIPDSNIINAFHKTIENLASETNDRSTREINDWIHALGDFGKLLRRLREMLDQLAVEETHPSRSEGDTWVRVKSTDVEVHVKAPRTATERARIRTIQRALEMLLEQNPGPSNRQ